MGDTSQTKSCPKCNRANPKSRAACIYCGNKFESGPSSDPVTTREGAASRPLPPTSNGATSGEASGNEGGKLRSAKLLDPNRCPRCERQGERGTIQIEFWKYKRYSIWGRRKFFDVITASIPGYCERCTELLSRKKLIASLCLVFPLWIIMASAFAGSVLFSSVATVVYFGWILRGARYCWVDQSAFGSTLEADLQPEIQSISHPPDATIQFPIGFKQSLARTILIPGLPIFAILFFAFLVKTFHIPTPFKSAVSKMATSEAAISRVSPDYAELTKALEDRDEGKIMGILSRNHDVLKKRDEKGKTLLHLAVKTNNDRVIFELIERGADIEAGDTPGETTPLHYAALGRYGRSVQALIEKKANVNARTKDGTTPLIFAAMTNDLAIAEMLMAHGADATATEKAGHSALYYATLNHNSKLESVLRGAGAH